MSYIIAVVEVFLRLGEKILWIIGGCVYTKMASYPGNIACGLMLLMYLIQALSTLHFYQMLKAF